MLKKQTTTTVPSAPDKTDDLLLNGLRNVAASAFIAQVTADILDFPDAGYKHLIAGKTGEGLGTPVGDKLTHLIATRLFALKNEINQFATPDVVNGLKAETESILRQADELSKF